MQEKVEVEETKHSQMQKWLKVFSFGFMIDIMYVLWIWSVGTGNVMLAGIAAVLLALPSLLGYLEIVDNRKMMIPYLSGLFLGSVTGTYLAKIW